MAAREDSERGGSWFKGCMLYGIAIPVALVAVLGIIFYINNLPPKFRLPPRAVTVPKDNGWDDFERAGEMIKKAHAAQTRIGPRSISDWSAPKYQAFIRANAPALAVMRRGLNKECVYPPVTDTLNPSSTGFSRYMQIAESLRGEFMYYETVGEHGKAVDSRLDCVELGVMAPRGGMLLEGLVALGVEAVGVKGISPEIAKLNPSELERVSRRLDRIRKKRVPFGEIVMEEGRFSVLWLDQTLRQPDRIKRVCTTNSSLYAGTGMRPTLDDRLQDLKFAFANKTAMAHNRWAYCEAFAKEQAGPYTGKSSVRTSDDYFSGSIEPFVRSRGSFVRSEARLTVIGTEVALRRYRADHGSYPTDLRALTSTYLKTVPVDPFGQGRSLCYKAINGGKSFLLYSIGSDMKDDGGRFEGWTNMKSSGDIVAGKL